MNSIILDTEAMAVEIDPGHGADILSLFDRRSGTELLFSTPWRAKADAIRAGAARSATLDSEQSWLEQYRGGWQTLCPNAGPPRRYRGADLGFHGEASMIAWKVEEVSGAAARLTVELFTVPVTIKRTISLSGATLNISDELINKSDDEWTIDFSHHPALGGAFLKGECEVTTNATLFTSDDLQVTEPVEVTPTQWRLGRLPAAGAPVREFGWLSGFHRTSPAWAAVSNPELGITVRLSWDPEILPYAWWWQEFNASNDFPWFGQARVFAIEPASTPTSGPHRISALTIPPNSSVHVPLQLSIDSHPSAPS